MPRRAARSTPLDWLWPRSARISIRVGGYRFVIGRHTSWPVLAMIALVLLIVLVTTPRQDGVGRSPVIQPGGEGYLVCFWNVENLCDDTNDFKNTDPIEDWFAANPRALALKLDLLAETLLAMNGGRGPDLLALVEVENRRAVELLRDRLHRELPPEFHYRHLAHHDLTTGRRVEPAILSRLPINPARTRTFGQRRILQVVVEVDGDELAVLVAHWTSRLTDQEGTKRLEYGRACLEAVEALRRLNPAADVLVMGDFNDHPQDRSLTEGLRAGPSPSAIDADGTPFRLWNLMTLIEPGTAGTYWYRGGWEILDHLVVSPGLVDQRGWQVLPKTLTLGDNSDRRPLRFGAPNHQEPRGPSDHLPVSVRVVRVRSPSN